MAARPIAYLHGFRPVAVGVPLAQGDIIGWLKRALIRTRAGALDAQDRRALILSDTTFYRNPHYHEHTDTPDTLDYERMAKATEALVEALDVKP